MRTESLLRPQVTPTDFGVPTEYQERAENYAKWVAACEREACAKLCDQVQWEYGQYTFSARVSAERIRARD